MPRYEYKCSSCDLLHLFHHGMNDPPPLCPSCGDNTLIKSVSSFNTKPKKETANKVGEVTEDFIKSARRELGKQKEEMKENR